MVTIQSFEISRPKVLYEILPPNYLSSSVSVWDEEWSVSLTVLDVSIGCALLANDGNYLVVVQYYGNDTHSSKTLP